MQTLCLLFASMLFVCYFFFVFLYDYTDQPEISKVQAFFSSYIKRSSQEKTKQIIRMSMKSKEEEIQIIIHHWIRTLNIKLGWIQDFDKFVVNYSSAVFLFDTFRSSKLINTITGHTNFVNSIDYSTFDSRQLICSGSNDNTIRVCDVDNNKQIQLFNEHSDSVDCVKFSSYHYHSHRQNVICYSSDDKTIRLWDFKDNMQLQTFNGHTSDVYGIEFSQFNGGSYLCSGSGDKTIRLWDVETSKSLHVFNGHERGVRNNKNDNKMSDIG
ncbi:F-box and wd40 domain protein, partial [Reticulomyxa filosa]